MKNKFIKKDDNEEIFKQQSKLTFDGIHKSYTKYKSYTLKQNEVLMDKAFHLGYTVIELSKVFLYVTYYDNLQPFLENKKSNMATSILMLSY